MAHMPINHPFRPLYRVVAAACGIATLVFGLVALGGDSLLANESGAALAILLGALTLAGAIIRTNLGRWLHLVTGVGLLIVGTASLALLRSEDNLLGFSVTTCIVAFLIGLALLTCGLYEQVGPSEKQEREELFRHGRAPDPEEHLLGAHHVPRSEVSGPAAR
jgi:hypothetical protein